MSRRVLKDQMLERLMTASGWLTPVAMAAGLSTSRMAIEDALADLVVEQSADYKPAAGYRLKGTVLCRQALRLLKTHGGTRAVRGHPAEGVYRLGVAEARADLGLVMYELALPLPPDGPDHLRLHLLQVDAILKFTKEGEANG